MCKNPYFAHQMYETSTKCVSLFNSYLNSIPTSAHWKPRWFVPFVTENLFEFLVIFFCVYFFKLFFTSLFQFIVRIMDDGDNDNNTNINNSSGTMPLSLDAHTQGKCKLIKCSRHFNQNGLISMGDRIYANSTTTDQCNYSKCLKKRKTKTKTN